MELLSTQHLLPMPDYLQPVGRRMRWLAASGITLAAAGLWLLSIGLGMQGIYEQAFKQENVGLWFAVVFLGLLAAMSSFAALRLWRGTVSSNCVTCFPTWFIETSSVVFFIGGAVGAYFSSKSPDTSRLLYLAELTMFCSALLLVRRRIALKNRER